MPTLLNNAEAQASGTTVLGSPSPNTGNANSDALDDVSIGTNMALTMDSAISAAHGSNAFKFALTSTATNITYLGWTPTAWGTGVARMYGAFYFRTNVASIANTIRLVQFRSGTTVLGYIGRNNGTSGFHFRTAADAQAGTISAAVSANTWYRVEFDIIPGGTSNLNVYVGDSATVQGSAASLAGTIGGTTVDNLRFGFNTASFSLTSGDYVLLDSLNVNDVAVPGPGPYTKSSGGPVFSGGMTTDLHLPRFRDWKLYGTEDQLFAPAAGAASFTVTATDAITLSESPARTAQSFSRPLPTDALTFSESQARTTAVAKTSTDAVTFSESNTASAGKTRPVTDAITFAESLTRGVQGFTRALPTDSLTFSEARARIVTASRALTDSVTFSESVLSGRSIGRAITDALAFSESLTRGAAAHPRTIVDSVTFAESLARTVGLPGRTGTDSITFSEAVLSGRSITRLVTDAVTLTETLTRAALSYSRLLPVDSLTFSEARARTLSVGRTGTDSVTFAEALTSGRSISRALTDAITFSETVTRLAGRVRALTDAVTFSEATARTLVLVARQLTDAIHFAESITSGKAVARSAIDTLTFAESVAKGFGRTRTATDALTFTDTPARGALIFTRTPADAITFAEVLDQITTSAIVAVGLLESSEAVAILEGNEATTVIEGATTLVPVE